MSKNLLTYFPWIDEVTGVADDEPGLEDIPEPALTIETEVHLGWRWTQNPWGRFFFYFSGTDFQSSMRQRLSKNLPQGFSALEVFVCQVKGQSH